MDIDVERAMTVAREAAAAAGAVALRYWRTDLRVERKPTAPPSPRPTAPPKPPQSA